MGVNRVTAVGDPADMWSWLWGPYLVPPDFVGSWRTDWNVRNVKLKCLKYWIEIPIQDWNGARWNVWRCGTSSRHIGPFRAITICITIVARDKKCRLARPRLSVSILVNTYRCLWLQQKLLKSCGGTFQTCRYKIICICSWLVNFHCLTHILTIKLMQQMGSDAIRWRLLTGRLLVGQIWFGTFEGRSTNVLYWGMIFNYGQFEWSTVEYSGWRLEWSHLEVSQTLATSGVMTFPNWPKMYPRDYNKWINSDHCNAPSSANILRCRHNNWFSSLQYYDMKSSCACTASLANILRCRHNNRFSSFASEDLKYNP